METKCTKVCILDDISHRNLCGNQVVGWHYSKDWMRDKVVSKTIPDDVCQGCLTSLTYNMRDAQPDDNVNHPSHYNQGKIEVIEFIEDQKLGFNLGNALKYICRAGKKNPNVTEDLRKARWYLKREIELVTSSCENRKPLRPNEMPDAT